MKPSTEGHTDICIFYIYIYRPIASDLLSEENNEYLLQSRGKKVITPPPPPNKKARHDEVWETQWG